MAATVGATSCTFVKSQVRDLRHRLNTWQREGIDGYGVQMLGFGNSEFRVLAVLWADSHSAAKTWAAALRAMIGTIVTIVDDFAESHTGSLIEDVGPPQYRMLADTRVRAECLLTGKIVPAAQIP